MDLTLMNRDRILEAIDQLRHRKARPDIQRICSYLFRRFHVNSAEAKKDLDWCVANNYVLKVEYKGSISYRNAAKKLAQMKHRGADFHRVFPAAAVAHFQGNFAGAVALNGNGQHNNVAKVNKNFGELLTNVIGELIINEPDYLEDGVPAHEIIDSVLAKDSARYTKNYVIILLEKEVERRNLIRLENGNYLMGPPKRDEKDKDGAKPPADAKRDREAIKKNETEADANKAENASQVTEAKENNKQTKKQQPPKANGVAENKEKPQKIEKPQNMDATADEKKQDSENLRVGGRRKKAKKVFDPSDTHVPKKRGRPAGSLNRSTIEKQLAKLSEEMQAQPQPRPDSRTSNGSREQGGVCSVCHLQNKKGPNDRLVSCRECSNKAHFGCLNNGEDMMLKMYPDNTWQCPHCKTCVVCYETSDAGSLIVCSVCADGYHANCHQPKITEKIKNGPKWLCVNCQMPDELKINEIQCNIEQTIPAKDEPDPVPEKDKGGDAHSNASPDSRSGGSAVSGGSSPSYESPAASPPPPQLSPQTEGRREGRTPPESPEPESDSQSNRESEEPEDAKPAEEVKCKEEEEEDPNIDPSIPDATHWTADEVYQYFAQYFPEEAKIFKEQEIDGRSLLLLKRMDVLTNLNLKLGPALKIYKHVIRLQVRRDDRSLYYL